MTIHKHTIADFGDTIITVPKGSVFLTAQNQHEHLTLWFECNPDNEPESRQLRVICTGHTVVPFNRRYLATVQLESGDYVAHVYEVL